MSPPENERRGIPVSPGIAIGPAFVLRRERIVIPERRIPPEQVGHEVERLRRAFAQTRAKLEEIRRGMQGAGLVGTIFDAQFLFLEDPTLIEPAEAAIREQLLNAEWAIERQWRRLAAVFESMHDPYIKERSSDIGFVVRRVLEALMGREPEGLRNAPPGVIVVAEEVSPGEVAQVTRDSVAGFVTETGSRTSHVTIMARSLGIPAVVGVGGELARELADGVTLVLDGRTGRVLVDPDAATIAEYRARTSSARPTPRSSRRSRRTPRPCARSTWAARRCRPASTCPRSRTRRSACAACACRTTGPTCSAPSCARSCGPAPRAGSRSCCRWSRTWPRSSSRAARSSP